MLAKRKSWLRSGIWVFILLFAVALGFVPVQAKSLIKKPTITLKSPNLIQVGKGSSLKVQGNVVKSISNGTFKVKSVKFYVIGRGAKIRNVKGKINKGVPPKLIVFTKRGTVKLKIVAKDFKGYKTVKYINFRVVRPLENYCKGVKNWYMSYGSNLDFNSAISLNAKYVKRYKYYTNVNVFKPGSYYIKYTLTGVSSDTRVLKKKVIVRNDGVVSSNPPVYTQ